MAQPQARLNVLVSYGTLRAGCAEILRPDWDVFLDSGAFTNFKAGKDVVSFDEYAAFLQEHGSKFWKYVSLDRIGDPEGSRQNFEKLRALGLQPVPVFQRGAPLAEFDEMASKSDLVAIGGIAGAMYRSDPGPFIASVLQRARRLGVRVHLLGVGSLSALREHRPFSADASSFTAAHRYGATQLWDTRARRFVMVGRKQKLTRDLLQLLARYDVTAENIRDRDWWGAHPREKRVLRASSWSAFEFTEHLARLGVKYFLASGDPETWLLGGIWDAYLERKQRCTKSAAAHAV